MPGIFGGLMTERSFQGYEIHLGETIYQDRAHPFSEITRLGESASLRDGVISSDGFVFGTYVHGLFDNDRFRHAFLRVAREGCGLAAPGQTAFVTTERERRIDRLAGHVRSSLDMELIKSWLRTSIPVAPP
ncbi:MAG: hypothetical protein DMG09_01595 [Acidobacteria bacterium]|nr:MAG: hypothetical protein DMG09_01595 [Acidobacteriota bacterium]